MEDKDVSAKRKSLSYVELRVEDSFKDRNLFHMSITRGLENQEINRDKRDRVLAVKKLYSDLNSRSEKAREKNGHRKRFDIERISLYIVFMALSPTLGQGTKKKKKSSWRVLKLDLFYQRI